MNLKDSKTFTHLAEAFAGECMARTRYEFIEYGARMAGDTSLADIVKKLAFNEFNHARMLYTAIQSANKSTITNVKIATGYPFKEKWNVLDNIKFAAENERNEGEEIYPEFAKVAAQEGFKDIEKLFLEISTVEKSHASLLLDIHSQMKTGTIYKKTAPVVWMCADCGYRATSCEAFSECPLCKAKQGHVALKLATCAV
ncbi:MAG: hypothetical protein LBE09_07280 [Christensenellaceae bacterium]|jgi:rubrerythrin|nr:hypothetical protein [Christensenellaceae bacterium]